MKFDRITLPIGIVGAIILAILGWSTSYFGTVSAQTAAVADIRTAVAVLQKSDSTQDAEITSLTTSLDTLNKNVVKLLIHNGIQPAQ